MRRVPQQLSATEKELLYQVCAISTCMLLNNWFLVNILLIVLKFSDNVHTYLLKHIANYHRNRLIPFHFKHTVHELLDHPTYIDNIATILLKFLYKPLPVPYMLYSLYFGKGPLS